MIKYRHTVLCVDIFILFIKFKENIMKSRDMSLTHKVGTYLAYILVKSFL